MLGWVGHISPASILGAQDSRVRLQHHDARYTAQQPPKGPTVPSCNPIASRRCAGRGHRESHQCQLAMGAVQAESLLWCPATDTQELDGWTAVDTR
jgi:hypothetical protein